MAHPENYAATARRWELTHGFNIVDEIHSSGVAQRMLRDVCVSASRTVDFATKSGLVSARDILAQYPLVLSKCDSLSFNEPAQALAYLALHLPDRYCRVFQVLEALLVRGMLPLGRAAGFAAVDIGAGPGPGVFAVRNFYAALNYVTGRQHPERHVSTLGATAVIERSEGMIWAMRQFAEQLVIAEQRDGDLQSPTTSGAGHPNPCAEQLAASAVPFASGSSDFRGLDLRDEHHRARLRHARELQEELDVSSKSAIRLAYQESIGVPSGYAIALMTNFLTTPDGVPRFADAIRRLMRGALVPGGLVLVLGALGAHYGASYEALDRIAVGAGLRVLEGFDEPIQAGSRSDEFALLQRSTRHIWQELANGADNSAEVQRELLKMRAGDIFDTSTPYSLPRFRVRAYRRGRWP